MTCTFFNNWLPKTMLLTILIAGAVLFGSGAPARAQDLTIIVNSQRISFQQPPHLENGRVIVPLRPLLEAFGAEVNWDPQTLTAIISHGNRTVHITTGSLWVRGDSGFLTTETPAGLMEGRLYVPLRLAAQYFGFDVQWDAATRTVRIAASPNAGDSLSAGTPGSSPVVHVKRVQTRNRNGISYVSLSEFQPAAALQGWRVTWNTTHRVLHMWRDRLGGGRDEVELTYGIPVAKRNGSFLPTVSPLLLEDGEVWIATPTVTVVLGWETEAHPSGELGLRIPLRETWPQPPVPPSDRAALLRRLAHLQKPIAGAATTFPNSHLPGAPRPYRNGVHQGLDWYGYALGVPIGRNTPVRAVAPGVVIRADHDYRTPTAAARQNWLDASRQAETTPEWILDRLRGRQVWVLHDGNILARYAHLGSIAEGITVGTRVQTGETLAWVGNSGTSSEVLGRNADLHLHLDLLIDGQNIWRGESPAEIRSLIRDIFR